MSTALELLQREHERLVLEVQELRRSRPRPLTLRLADVGDGEVLSEERLADYLRAQRHNTLQFQPDELKELVVVDRVGRRIKHFLGDVNAVWSPFTGVHKRITGYNLLGRKAV